MFLIALFKTTGRSVFRTLPPWRISKDPTVNSENATKWLRSAPVDSRKFIVHNAFYLNVYIGFVVLSVIAKCVGVSCPPSQMALFQRLRLRDSCFRRVFFGLSYSRRLDCVPFSFRDDCVSTDEFQVMRRRDASLALLIRAILAPIALNSFAGRCNVYVT